MMKWNMYDLFDNYNAEKYGVPEVQPEPIAVGNVETKVLERCRHAAATETRKRFRLTKMTAVLAAAVVLVTGGTMMTAAAGSGGLERFFHSVFPTDGVPSAEKMTGLVTLPAVNFDSSNSDVQLELLGMYGDDDQVMLSFAVKASEAVTLSEDWNTVAEITTTSADGTVEDLSQTGQTYALHKSKTEDGVYNLNIFLTHSGLQGKTMDISFQNFYTTAQTEAVYQKVAALDDDLMQKYITKTFGENAMDGLTDGALPDGFDVDAWKAYRQEQNYDQLAVEKYAEFYAQSENAVAGTWHAEIPMQFATDTPIVASYAYGEIELQTLSAKISYPSDMEQPDTAVGFLITLKDGRKMDTNAFPEDVTDDNTQVALSNQYVEWNADKTVQTEVACYGEPIAPQDIAEITMQQYKFDADRAAIDDSGNGGFFVTDAQVIYTAQ